MISADGKILFSQAGEMHDLYERVASALEAETQARHAR